MLDLTGTGYFYFVIIIKRAKDNPGAGISYADYIDYYTIQNKKELLAKEKEIISKSTNCRVYIKMNKRSMAIMKNQANLMLSGKIQLKDVTGKPHVVTNQKDAFREACRHSYVEATYAHEFPSVLLDIDTTDKKVHDGVIKMMRQHHIRIWFEYNSPNGGWHVITKGREVQKLDFKVFDGGVDKGLFATVDAAADALAMVYCNIVSQGYKKS